MNKLLNLAGAAALLVAAGVSMNAATPVAPSSKATARVSNIHLVDGAQQLGWTTIMSSRMKTANKTDLLANVSLEAGLLTRTKIKGKAKKRAMADAFIKVRCLVNGQLAYPGEVVFTRRRQILSTDLASIISDCLLLDEETGAVILDEECTEPSSVLTLLQTMSANSFNFIYPDCLAGDHEIQIQCQVGTSAIVDDGVSVDAVATIGKGAFTVQAVRLTHGEDIEL
jgi:hypothetical protein